MKKKSTLAMAMLFAITAQSQNVLQFTPQSQDVIQFSTDKLATDKVFTEADVTVGAPRTQSNTQSLVLHQAPLNSKLGVELQQYLCSANVKSQRKMAAPTPHRLLPTPHRLLPPPHRLLLIPHRLLLTHPCP